MALLEPGVAVAERVDRDARHEVEIRLAVGVEQLDAGAAHELHRRTPVDAEQRVGGR